MEPSDTKTPSELAGEAVRAVDDAGQAARGYASESRRIIRDAVASVRPSAEEFKDLAAEAADTTSGLARDARDLSGDAVRTARGYADRGLAAARANMLRLAGRAEDSANACRRYVAENPAIAAIAAAATGAILMALVRHAARGRGRPQAWQPPQ